MGPLDRNRDSLIEEISPQHQYEALLTSYAADDSRVISNGLHQETHLQEARPSLPSRDALLHGYDTPSASQSPTYSPKYLGSNVQPSILRVPLEQSIEVKNHPRHQFSSLYEQAQRMVEQLRKHSDQDSSATYPRETDGAPEDTGQRIKSSPWKTPFDDSGMYLDHMERELTSIFQPSEAKQRGLDHHAHLIEVISNLLPLLDERLFSPQFYHDDFDFSSSPRTGPYTPNYAHMERQVVEDALSIAQQLHSSLLDKETPLDVLAVANHLTQLWGEIKDAGISTKCVAEVAIRHLHVLEVISRISDGGMQWVGLKYRWRCSTTCVYELGMAGISYINQHGESARTAADLAQKLSTRDLTHTGFYRAIGLHYLALSLFADNEQETARDTLKRSLHFFDTSIPPTPSDTYVLESIRVALSYCRVFGVPTKQEPVAAGAFEKILSLARAAPSDQILALAITELAEAMFLSGDWPKIHHEYREFLSLAMDAVDFLRPYHATRPSRFRAITVRALHSCAYALRDSGLEARALLALEEAIEIQHKVAQFHVHDQTIGYLILLLTTYVEGLLHLRRWLNALHTTKYLVHLVKSTRSQYGSDFTHHIYVCLHYFPIHLMQQPVWDSQALNMTRGLVDTILSTITWSFTPQFVEESVEIMLSLSDFQRVLGEPEPALDTYNAALLVSKECGGHQDLSSARTFIEALIGLAYSLIDADAHEAAAAHHREAAAIWERLSASFKWYNPQLETGLLILSTMVHSHFGRTNEAILCIQEVIDRLRPLSPDTLAPGLFHPTPYTSWIQSIRTSHCVGATDTFTWSLLLKTVIKFPEESALHPAQECLTRMSAHYRQHNADMNPYQRSIVLGNKYILLIILGKDVEGVHVLDQFVPLYRSALISEPRMAQLPLLVYLEVLLMLVHGLPSESLRFSVSNIQTWKKILYEGSNSFLDELVTFLRDLPHYLQIKNRGSGIVLKERDSASAKDNVQVSASAPIDPQQQTTEKSRFETHSQLEPLPPGRSNILQDSGEILHSVAICKLVVERPNEVADISRTGAGDIKVGLSGKKVHFVQEVIRASTSTSPANDSPDRTPDNIADLTEHIRIIDGPLKAGGFCDVYSGEFESNQRTEKVALKMLRVFINEAYVSLAMKKFRREVRVWCQLRHPHVLPFYGTCELDEFRLFMVSPWAGEGNSLEYLRSKPLTNRTRILWEIATALEYLHSGKDAPVIVHGDIKADNVLISSNGYALLSDFGLSSYALEEMLSKGGAVTSHVGGHVRFTAPELFTSPKDTTEYSRPRPETDVYAFASLMLQIYTEKLPFGNVPEVQVIFMIVRGEHPPRPTDPAIHERGFDDYLWEVMTDCWEVEPRKRPSMKMIGERIKASKQMASSSFATPSVVYS